tara:strand:- start:126 stop:494 length:369 start_codon:yes stop_codon:yes gene_type:complete
LKGLQALIQARLGGSSQRTIWIASSPICWLANGIGNVPGDQPWLDLEIEACDRPELLDLRCVVGMIVIASGFHSKRIDEIVSACLAHGARRVFGIVFKAGPEHFEIVDVYDSWENTDGECHS